MKIGYKIFIAIVVSVAIAFAVGTMKGEIVFVEGVSGLLVFLLPLISVAVIMGIDNIRQKIGKALVVAGVALTILLIVGLLGLLR